MNGRYNYHQTVQQENCLNNMEAHTQKKLKPGVETGSFVNMMMSQNSTLPEVGKGATVLHWTDRHAYEVIEVSNNKKRVVVQQYLPKRIDKNGMSESQEYEYKELSPVKEVIVWKWGGWRFERDELIPINEEQYYSRSRKEIEDSYDENGFMKHQQGLTKWVKKYHKVDIVWGEKREYYDFTF